MRRYRPDYSEFVSLPDGTSAQLRLVGPEDRALVVKGFSQLSDQTRYERFFAHKPQLTSQDLDYLTQVDGEAHLAIGAVGLTEEGWLAPMGIARFIRYGEAQAAEGAIVVVDAYQGRGLGQVLLERLGEAAWERGVRRLEFTTLAKNRRLHRLVASSYPNVVTGRIEEGIRTLQVQLNHGAEHPLRAARLGAGQWANSQLTLLRGITAVRR